MTAAAPFPALRASTRRLWLVPSLPDLLFPLLVLAVFGRPAGWQALLGDGDTGWHIRAGEYILDHGVPRHDLFSFSRPGEPWFAWEWLSETVFAQFHRWWGLEGVAMLGAVLVCLPAALLFAWLLRRGSGAWVALATVLAAASASSIHYLARPHLFSSVLLVAGLWLLDEDRRSPTPWLWILVPTAGLWANLHGGYAAWLAVLALAVLASLVERDRAAFRRYGALAVLSAGATLVNPYGWQLDRHVIGYLGSSWIAEHVSEFQSPQFRSENMLVFAVLLLAGTMLAARGKLPWFERSLVFVWGFAALRSARYVPVFAVVVAPAIALQLAAMLEQKARVAGPRSALRLLWESSADLGGHCRITPWMAILGAAAVWAVLPTGRIADFPEAFFPVAAVNQNSVSLTVPAGRVLTSDQWADYLIYRLYPRTPVFFDGRSDFYGERIGEDYRMLLAAGRDSRGLVARYGFTAALLPLDWPLGQILEQDPGWRVVYRDRQAVLLVREGAK